MKEKTRDRLLCDVLRYLRFEENSDKRYVLYRIGESLVTENLDLKKKDVEKQLAQWRS